MNTEEIGFKGHPFAEWVEKGVKEFIKEYPDAVIPDVQGRTTIDFRHYDISVLTDEPGNTNMFITFFRPLLVQNDNWEDLKSFIWWGVEDHQEYINDIIVTTQNNETVVIISDIK